MSKDRESHFNPEGFMLLKLFRPELMEWISWEEIAEFDSWLTMLRFHARFCGGPYL